MLDSNRSENQHADEIGSEVTHPREKQIELFFNKISEKHFISPQDTQRMPKRTKPQRQRDVGSFQLTHPQIIY